MDSGCAGSPGWAVCVACLSTPVSQMWVKPILAISRRALSVTPLNVPQPFCLPTSPVHSVHFHVGKVADKQLIDDRTHELK